MKSLFKIQIISPQLSEVILLTQKNRKVEDETLRTNLCALWVSWKKRAGRACAHKAGAACAEMEMLPRLPFHTKLLHYIFRRASHGFLVRGAVFFN